MKITLATHYPASQRAVEFVLAQDVETGDGRSDWRWFRLANGDLILGVFPQGDTYTAVTECEPWSADHEDSDNLGRAIGLSGSEVNDLLDAGHPDADLNNLLAQIESAVVVARGALANEAEGQVRESVRSLLASALSAEYLVERW